MLIRSLCLLSHPTFPHTAQFLRVLSTQQISISWELVRHAHFGPHVRPTQSETLVICMLMSPPDDSYACSDWEAWLCGTVGRGSHHSNRWRESKLPSSSITGQVHEDTLGRSWAVPRACERPPVLFCVTNLKSFNVKIEENKYVYIGLIVLIKVSFCFWLVDKLL